MLGLVLAPLVAVLPFRDASGAGPSGVGEAVRAAATAELTAAGVRVVPRDQLERAVDMVGAELEQQELDASPSVAKLCRTTGADAVLAGAYDVRGAQVKLWARFYQGKKGRLLSTMTVGGPGTEFLLLVHGMDVELLRALRSDGKLEPKPLVRSLRAVDLYGQAEAARSEEARRELLRRAVDQDPTFQLAVRALDLLPPDPGRTAERLLARFAELQAQRRWHQLVREAGAVVARPPLPVPELSEQLPEVAQVLIVAASDRLHDDDAVVSQGQKFLAEHPSSKSAPEVKQLVDGAAEQRRARMQGVEQAAVALGRLRPDERKDACHVGLVYEETSQLREARDALAACVAAGRPPDYLAHLVWVEFRLGNFAAVPPLLEKLRKSSPTLYPQVARVADELPAD